MQKIKRLENIPDSLLSRVIGGGSQPRYYYVRFIGKSPFSPTFPKDKYLMDNMVENEFISYKLAEAAGVNVPSCFIEKYDGAWYFFSKDIDPRPDDETNTYYAEDKDLSKLDKQEVALANAFNVWILNEEITGTGRANMIIVNNKLYMIDFTGALLGYEKDKWRQRLELAREDKEAAKRTIWNWSSITPEEFQRACDKIKLINNFRIDNIIKKTFDIGLIDKEKYIGLSDFLIERKGKILKLVR